LTISSIQAAELTLEQTQNMALAAEAKAKEMGINVSVAILDQHGNPKLFFRMDGASTGSTKIARLKANTSASFRISSRKLGENNLNQPNHAYNHFPEVILLPGGLPINVDGEVVGGIGVSGATADQDEIVAQAAIDGIAQQG
jgi:glc operon protein GlcG